MVYTVGLLFLIVWGLDLERSQSYRIENKQLEIIGEYRDTFESSFVDIMSLYYLSNSQTFAAKTDASIITLEIFCFNLCITYRGSQCAFFSYVLHNVYAAPPLLDIPQYI